MDTHTLVVVDEYKKKKKKKRRKNILVCGAEAITTVGIQCPPLALPPKLYTLFFFFLSLYRNEPRRLFYLIKTD